MERLLKVRITLNLAWKNSYEKAIEEQLQEETKK